MMIKSAFFVFMGAVFALPVGAAICVEDNVQKCAELGYTQESCKYGGVACPYDKSKLYCAKWKCQDGRYFPVGTIPNINQEAVTTTYKDMECVDLIDVKCDIGNVYYHDGTCGIAANYDGSKIPVGIVFATSPSYNWGKIVSINNLALKNKAYFDINNPYSSSKAMYWGFSGYKSASLTSLTLENLTKAIIDENYEAIDGLNNTKLISGETSLNTVCTNGSLSVNSEDYAKQCVPSAFLAALAYYPHISLSANSVVGAGKWYVPSMYEAMQLYGYDFNNVNANNNKSGALRDVLNKVNASLSALRAKGVNALIISGSNLVSNELSLSAAFSLNFDEGTRELYTKSDVANLRVIAQWADYTCEDGGYSSSRATTVDKNVVAVKYKNLTCYTFEDYKCQVGDIYYADNSCSNTLHYDDTKIPVGVIFEVDSEGKHGKIVNLYDIALTNFQFNPQTPYTGTNIVYPSLIGYDIPSIYNIIDISQLVAEINSKNPSVINGREQTNILYATQPINANCGEYSVNSMNYAGACAPLDAIAGITFYPDATVKNSNIIGAGAWYVPSMYELMTLYGYNFNILSPSSSTSGATSDVIQKVYTTLQYLQARGRAKTIDNSPLGIYSSINECNQTYIWGLSFNNGEMKKILKANGSKLRLIAGF